MAKAARTGGTLSEGKARASPVPSRRGSPQPGAGPSKDQANASTSQLKQPKPKAKQKQQQSKKQALPTTPTLDRTGTLLKVDLQLWTTLVRTSNKPAYDWIQRNLTLNGLSTSALTREAAELKLYEVTSKNGKKRLYIGGGECGAVSVWRIG